MGAFSLGESSSKTTDRKAEITGPVTASGGTASSQLVFGSSNVSAAAGGLALGHDAVLAGTYVKAGKGGTVNITTTDNGAFQQAQNAIERIVQGQADNVAAALGSLGNIAETRGTDGANLAAGFAGTATKGIFGAAVVGALLLVVVLFLKRH